MEIGMLISIRYDSHLEGIIRRVTYCQTNTIYRYRPFVYSNISTFRHLFVKCIFEREIPTSIRILYIHASSGLVHMSLHDMPVQTAVHHHATFYIHLVTYLQQPEIGTFQSLFHGSHGIGIISKINYCQTHPIV